jgi:hypothetical protein
MDLIAISPFYDFSLLEQAGQSFFCNPDGPVAQGGGAFVAPPNDDDDTRENWTPGANIPFYTAFQNDTFQKCRPRVWAVLPQITAVPFARTLDANGQFRVTAWTALMKFGVLSEPFYPKHIALRTLMLAAIPMLGPVITADGGQIATTGINAFLQYHQLAQIEILPASTYVDTSNQGYYVSYVDTQITFSILPAKYPTN